MPKIEYDRKQIAARMRALAAKTVNNGCTEEEAATALSMLLSFQERYNVSLEDDGLDGEGQAYHPFKVSNDNVYSAAGAIAKATDTKVVIYPEKQIVMYFGTLHDVEYATYLTAIVDTAARTSFNKFIIDPRYNAFRKAGHSEPIIRLSYTRGIVERLQNRILAMLKPLELRSQSGQELIILKDNKAQQMLNELGVKETPISTELAVIREIMDQGKEDADNIALNKGIETASQDTQLLN